MISEITLATTNKGKVSEFERAFENFKIKFKAISADIFNCPETASTFLGNALLKAQMAANITQNYALADDSGLCVKALGEEPGIYSARYFEKGQGLQKILSSLQGSSNRQAYFICALVLVNPQGQVIWQTEQKWNGLISQQIKGDKGFGYDPIFIPEGLNCTVGELEPAIKEEISHRGKAINELKSFLQFINVSS